MIIDEFAVFDADDHFIRGQLVMFVSLLNYVSEFVLRQEWHRQWRGESEIDAAPTARAIGK